MCIRDSRTTWSLAVIIIDDDHPLTGIHHIAVPQNIIRRFICTIRYNRYICLLYTSGVDTVQYAGDTTYQALQDYQVGGLVITKDNIDSSSQLKTMTEKLQSYSEEISGLPLFIAAAEEGGNDSVLGNNDSLDEYYEDSVSYTHLCSVQRH